MVPFVLIMVGLVLGFVVGWWALPAALVLGILVGVTEETEISGWVIGAYVALPAGIGIASGLVTRRLLARRSRPARA
jgi:hypothetical protein